MVESKDRLSELIATARWKTPIGGSLSHIVVPRDIFLQLVKEQEARRRCAAVLKKTHKEMKRQKMMNDWGKDKSGRWSNPAGSMKKDSE